MEKEFTQNQLISYIYRETSSIETLLIKEALQEDAKMNDDYTKLYEGYKSMPKATFAPSDSAIQNILRYSEATAVEMH